MPAFPQKFTSTVSHWQATNRGPTSLWDHGRDAPLPSETVDYVIIGAGVNGASMAYHLTRPGGAGDGKRVVVLEAKDVASGASGRNGGHIAPHGYKYIDELCKLLEDGGAGLSEEEAIDIYFFEKENLDYVESVVKKEGLDVDFWRGDRMEVIKSEAKAKWAQSTLDRFTNALQKSKYANSAETLKVFSDVKEAQNVGRIKDSIRVNISNSGSWHPHRGVTAFLRMALESKNSDCTLHSWTPVASVNQGSDSLWTVDCGARGTITARNVFVGTNGYTHHLFPEEGNVKSKIGSHVIPWRLSAGLITPPTTFSGAKALRSSYSIEHGPYLIHTPFSGIVLGPYVDQTLEGIGGDSPMAEVFGVEDDSFVFPGVRDWIANYCKDNYIGWGPEVDGEPGEGLARVWTGILGWSVDLVPLVGEVPGSPGLWVSVGFNGMGMSSIINITRHLSKIMVSGEWQGIPESYKITEERFERAKKVKRVV